MRGTLRGATTTAPVAVPVARPIATPEAVLVVGGGAREHALAWRLAMDGVARVLVAPGNPLMTDVAEVFPELATTDFDGLARLARREAELVVVGPEAPLVDGLADRLVEDGVACLGPSRAAAALEGSKAFCRGVAKAAGVAMAEGADFSALEPALDFAGRLGVPLVVKADGLAAGKGVTVCPTLEQAERAIREALGGRFGAAGGRVIVERALVGRELSLIALCGGDEALLLPASRDHKRLADGDSGPNTGGMGAYSPVEDLDDAQAAALLEAVHRPVLAEMAGRGTPFRGFLYAGLMLTADGPRLLEFNVRLGDPEAQAILPRLAAPLAPLLAAAVRGRLADAARALGLRGPLLPAQPEAVVGLTLAAEGYPEAPRSGDLVEGLAAARRAGGLVFGAGVALDVDGTLTTAGGRVLTAVGRGEDLAAARENAYRAADAISFAGRQLRRDIGAHAADALAMAVAVG
jgi:phosphoribosylamine--glycine ligase